MPTNIVAANYTADRDFSGEIKAGESIDITTSQAAIPFDVLVLYRVKSEDVWKVFNNFARQTTEQIQSTRIRREIKNVANVVSGRFNLEELTGKRRDEANVIFKEELTKALAPLGFTVEEAFFVTAYPNDQLRTQWVSLEIADLQRQIASYNAESAKREKEIAIIKAEAEQKAAQIIANSMTPKAKAIQDLDNQIAYWKRWDGSNIVADTTNLTSFYMTPNTLGKEGK
jgi:regulator of protease activity HflC (stomatin/prohibitin superfamily)